MSTLGKARFLTDEKRLLIALRLVVALVVVAFFFSRPAHFKTPWQFWYALVVFILSNAAFVFEKLKAIRTQRAHFLVFAFDLAMISVLVIFLGERSREFYVVFFMTIFVAAAGKSIRYTFAISAVMSALYWFLASRGVADVETFSGAFLTQVVFFFVVSMFVGYLSEEAEARRKRAEQLAEKARNAESARDAAEAVSVAKEERLKIMFEHAPDAHYLCDSEGVFVNGNRAAENLIGYKSKEFVGENFRKLDLLPAQDIPRAAELLAKNVRGLPTGPDEFDLIRKDGTRVTVETRTFPVRIGGDSLVLAIARDISESKRAEEARRESEERYRDLVETTDDLVQSVAPDGSILFVNRAWREALGYGEEEIRGMNIFGIIHPDSREHCMAVFQRVIAGEKVGDIEAQFVTKDGRTVIVEGSASCRFVDGKPFATYGIFYDVTERKRAEEALRASEQKYRALVENTKDVAYSTDAEGTLTYLGPQAARYGVDPEEAVSRNLLEFMVPEDRERIASEFERTMATGEEFPTEFRIVGPDGRRQWFEDQSKVLRDASGEVIGVSGALRDVTEHKRAEESLTKSEARMRSVIESGMIGILFWDAAGNMTDANDAFLRMVGYSRDEVLSATVSWRDMTPPEYKDQDDRALAEVATTGVMTPIEKEYIRKDGSRIPIVLGAASLPGPELNGVAFVLDITDRKRAEDALRERAKELDCLYQSSQIMAEPGKSLRDVMRGVASLIPPAWQYPDVTCARIVLEGEECRTDNFAETPWKHSAEIRVLGETVGSLEVCYLEGRPEAFEGPFLKEERDLIDTLAQEIGKFAERKRAEKTLRQTEEQLLQSQKLEAIGRLAGGIAHDFNNMLGAIIGYSDVILGTTAKEDPLYGDVQQIKGAGDRAAALTRQLLAFSRKQTLEPKVMDLNAAVTGLEKMLRRLIGEDIELATALAEDLGRVRADPGQMDQVIMNLAVNSRDAMPQGGKLTIETANVNIDENYSENHVSVKPGLYVMLAITDTGCGMEEETRAHIFEPFFTTKEVGKGTGLGLSTVYGIVKQSEGNIWVYSEPGKGTTFKVYLPCAEAAVEVAERRKPEEARARGTETVLVVEDEEVLRRLVCRILTMAGYVVLEARSGEEALLRCEERQGLIHLMVTDVVMPQMSGRRLAERVAVLRPETKVAYMSGYTDDAVVRNGTLDPDMPFIQKPFTASSLLAKVREALGPPEAGRQ